MYGLLFLKPIFKEAVGGGSRSRDPFGYDIPSDHTGECRAIGAHENGDCEVAEGEYQGKRLSELWTEHPELFGNEDGCLGERFPFLIKIIDAKERPDVPRTSFVPAKDQRRSYHTEAADLEHLETCGFYTVEKYEVHGCWQHKFSDRFANVSVLEGEGTVDGIPLKKGTHFIVPAGRNVCRFEGNMTLICSWIPAEEKETKEDEISIRVLDWQGRTKAFAQDPEESVLAFKDVYEEGDTIQFHFPETECDYVVRIDDTMDEALVYMTKKDLTFEVPFGEKKFSYNPKSFTGVRHYLTCRKAAPWETGIYRNLAKNVLDQHGDRGCYPHASANVETRGESVFAARNAIDGVTATLSHGNWPYESWGINRRDDAEFLLEFGRPVDIDKIRLWTRADFPHDNWWVSAALTFSDGTREVVKMEKSEKAHTFSITKKGITWIRLSELIKAEDPSPFPALTQIEVYGKEA